MNKNEKARKLLFIIFLWTLWCQIFFCVTNVHRSVGSRTSSSSSSSSSSHTEIYAATTEIEFLLDTYKVVIDDLDAYIMKDETRLMGLKKIRDTYKKEYDKAMEDIPSYVGDPINAFTMIKRLTTDLNDTEQRANIRSEFTRPLTKDGKDLVYPNINDLSEAAFALIRLQDTYKLSVDDLAEGIINGVAYSFPMSACGSDCFEMGRVLFDKKNYSYSLPWLMKTLSKYEQEDSRAYSSTEVEIMDYISWSYYNLGDVEKALEWTIKLISMHPSSVSKYHKNLLIFEEEIDMGEIIEETKTVNKTESEERYMSLCRGELEISPNVTKRLTCFYLTKHSPFLLLAPIKAEQRYVDPDILMYYDVISDREIEYLLATAKPMLERSATRDTKTKKDLVSSYRISKRAFICEGDSITRRVTDLTGLNMQSAESLMVNIYGIGGHFKPHYDYAPRENPFDDESGNRIATVLFYLSEVSQGGATVFTELGLTVFPVKNAALFWINLHPSGEGDTYTRHAGCPVLRGAKWIATKWIRQVGQEFIRPCLLEYQDENTTRQLPPPIPKTVP